MSASHPSRTIANSDPVASTSQLPHQPTNRANKRASPILELSDDDDLIILSPPPPARGPLVEVRRAQNDLSAWLEANRLPVEPGDYRWSNNLHCWKKAWQRERTWIIMGCGKARVSDWFLKDIPFGDTYAKRLTFAKARLAREMNLMRSSQEFDGLEFPTVKHSPTVTEQDFDVFDRRQEVVLEVAKEEDELEEDFGDDVEAEQRVARPIAPAVVANERRQVVERRPRRERSSSVSEQSEPAHESPAQVEQAAVVILSSEPNEDDDVDEQPPPQPQPATDDGGEEEDVQEEPAAQAIDESGSDDDDDDDDDDEDSQTMQQLLVPKSTPADAAQAPSIAVDEESSDESSPAIAQPPSPIDIASPMDLALPPSPPEAREELPVVIEKTKDVEALTVEVHAADSIERSALATVHESNESSQTSTAEHTTQTTAITAADANTTSDSTAATSAAEPSAPSVNPYYANRRKFAIPTARVTAQPSQAQTTTNPIVFGSSWTPTPTPPAAPSPATIPQQRPLPPPTTTTQSSLLSRSASSATAPPPAPPQQLRRQSLPTQPLQPIQPRPFPPAQVQPQFQPQRQRQPSGGMQDPTKVGLVAHHWRVGYAVPSGWPLQWTHHTRPLPHGLVELMCAWIEAAAPSTMFGIMRNLCDRVNIHLISPQDGAQNATVAEFFTSVIQHAQRRMDDPAEAAEERARRQTARTIAYRNLQTGQISLLPPLQNPPMPVQPYGPPQPHQQRSLSASAPSSSSIAQPQQLQPRGVGTSNFSSNQPQQQQQQPPHWQQQQQQQFRQYAQQQRALEQSTTNQNAVDEAARRQAKRVEVRQMLLPARNGLNQLTQWGSQWDALAKTWQTQAPLPQPTPAPPPAAQWQRTALAGSSVAQPTRVATAPPALALHRTPAPPVALPTSLVPAVAPGMVDMSAGPRAIISGQRAGQVVRGWHEMAGTSQVPRAEVQQPASIQPEPLRVATAVSLQGGGPFTSRPLSAPIAGPSREIETITID